MNFKKCDVTRFAPTGPMSPSSCRPCRQVQRVSLCHPPHSLALRGVDSERGWDDPDPLTDDPLVLLLVSLEQVCFLVCLVKV